MKKDAESTLKPCDLCGRTIQAHEASVSGDLVRLCADCQRQYWSPYKVTLNLAVEKYLLRNFP